MKIKVIMDKISKKCKSSVPGETILDPEARGAPGLVTASATANVLQTYFFILFSSERIALLGNLSGPSANLK